MTSPHPGDTWRGVFTPADGRADDQGDQPDQPQPEIEDDDDSSE